MPDSILPIRRALISVSDKTGLIILANALSSAGIIMLSTGGTSKALRGAGFDGRPLAGQRYSSYKVSGESPSNAELSEQSISN